MGIICSLNCFIDSKQPLGRVLEGPDELAAALLPPGAPSDPGLRALRREQDARVENEGAAAFVWPGKAFLSS